MLTCSFSKQKKFHANQTITSFCMEFWMTATNSLFVLEFSSVFAAICIWLWCKSQIAIACNRKTTTTTTTKTTWSIYYIYMNMHKLEMHLVDYAIKKICKFCFEIKLIGWLAGRAHISETKMLHANVGMKPK